MDFLNYRDEQFLTIFTLEMNIFKIFHRIPMQLISNYFITNKLMLAQFLTYIRQQVDYLSMPMQMPITSAKCFRLFYKIKY